MFSAFSAMVTARALRLANERVAEGHANDAAAYLAMPPLSRADELELRDRREDAENRRIRLAFEATDADIERYIRPRTTTLRLRRIRVSWDVFQSMTTRERDQLWGWIEAVFGLPSWKIDARRKGDEMVMARKGNL